MKTNDVVMVRVYVTESANLLNKIIDYLQDEAKVGGVSVFRAISGFGDSGVHVASLVDLSLDLPLAIEFFDSKDKIEPVLNYLNKLIKAEHIVFWNAKTNV